MKPLIVSFAEETDKSCINNLNKTAKDIFTWICYTLNESGHAPHIYKYDGDYIEFVIRKIKGTKVRLRWDMQRKIVTFANVIFRVNQSYWPVRVIEDIVGGEYMTYFTLHVNGKRIPVDVSFEDKDLTTEAHLEEDLPQLHQG